MVSDIDPVAFSAFEKQAWQQCASLYDRYFGLLTAQTGNKLLDAVAERPVGKELLDVATGPGYLAKQAERRGFTRIVGIDFSDVMIAFAKSEPSNIEFRVGDAQNIDERNASFDAVTMNFGLLHLSLPEKAIAESYRVLKHDGRFAFTVWAEPERALGFSIILDAINSHADKNMSLPAGPPFFHFSDSANSISALQNGGFNNCQTEELDLIWTLDSAEDLFNAFLYGTARVGGLMRMQTPDTLAKIKETLVKNAAPFQTGKSLKIPMSVVMSIGTK